jgi:hypothetical protein
VIVRLTVSSMSDLADQASSDQADDNRQDQGNKADPA